MTDIIGCFSLKGQHYLRSKILILISHSQGLDVHMKHAGERILLIATYLHIMSEECNIRNSSKDNYPLNLLSQTTPNASYGDVKIKQMRQFKYLGNNLK